MGDLGPYLDYDGEDYICTICDRWFTTEGALFAHCRATTRHEWCERCRRVFVSEDSKNAHVRASKRHNIYFETDDDLRYHLEDYHHACLECNIFLGSAENLLSHDISVHYYCNICDRYFGMLIHLESGACQSGVSEETIDDLAAECYQSRKYIVDTDGGWRYECPDCERQFWQLSALYQHVEDVPACSYLANGDGCLAKLERFMASRLP
ncbi:uncharacterized protein BO88DRAFT_470151 [Aspergillus vadensis CBS 113365]|uniref:C2H2-type domain-containing protein n=1 Tax=Aspergillus vadensis (strain CBS 113365 / IMI 142717 / IBT 24658) TaxID=1448311 RepID=A0A319BJL9_ASPVC|nr:hypothetical protein BO88DRAFT_470151 [Aspergillus vadensis CBS 113365]PYH65883.1 hypothetical protein BO88DRAFT_470151 [Aspergillus vadensis CBS 113365]